MKKKKPAAQSENWGSLTQSFPNYFAQECGVKVEGQPEIKKEANVSSTEEFSTLQDLFKTVVGCGEYVQKEGETTPTYDVDEIPALPPINLQEFNTMQNLFATMNPTSIQQET